MSSKCRFLLVFTFVMAIGLRPALADTVPANADSQVSFAQLAAKGGNLPYITVKNSPPGGLFQGFVRFDLSAIPPGSLVTRATLRAWVNYFAKPGRVQVVPAFAPWSEASLSAATAPPLGGPVATINVVSDRLRSYVNADITQLVQEWVNEDLDNNGIALVGDPTNDVFVRFDSKENIQGSHPIELELVLGDPVVNGAITDVGAGFGLLGGGSSADVDLFVDPNVIQVRVGSCGAGTAIQSVNEAGFPSCVDVGDIFGVTTEAGSGLVGGTAGGTANLAVDPNQYQRRVNTTPCAGAGLSVKSIDVNGNVTCAADTNSGGTVTFVDAVLGSGLTVTNNTTTPILQTDATIQRRTTLPTCLAGQALRSIAPDGSPVCQSLVASISLAGAFTASRGSEGTNSTTMVGTANSACFLTRVSTADVDSGDNEFGQCLISSSGGFWILSASMGPSGFLDDGGSVLCQAMCLQW